MVLSAMIAAVGIPTDSQILIVGAMVVGPEFGPISNVAYMGTSRWTCPVSARRTDLRTVTRDGTASRSRSARVRVPRAATAVNLLIPAGPMRG
jgi:hypothetical protein